MPVLSRWLVVPVLILAGLAQSARSAQVGAEYLETLEATEVCAGLYLSGLRRVYSPERVERMQAAAKALNDIYIKRSGVSAEQARKVIETRRDGVDAAMASRRLTETAYWDGIKACDQSYRQAGGSPDDQVRTIMSSPTPPSAARVAECQAMIGQAKNEFEFINKQITPNSSRSHRQKVRGNACFEMSVRYKRADQANCPADVLNSLRILRDGAQSLVDQVDAGQTVKWGCNKNY